FSFTLFVLHWTPISTFVPYTTLFRSDRALEAEQVGSPVGNAGEKRQHQQHRAETQPVNCVLDLNLGLAHPAQHKDRSQQAADNQDRKSTRLNSSHVSISYAVFCLNKK